MENIFFEPFKNYILALCITDTYDGGLFTLIQALIVTFWSLSSFFRRARTPNDWNSLHQSHLYSFQRGVAFQHTQTTFSALCGASVMHGYAVSVQIKA